MPKEKYIKNIQELDKKIVKRTALIDKLEKKTGKYASKIAEGKNTSVTQDLNNAKNYRKIINLAQENIKDKRNRRLNVIKLKQTSRLKSKAKRRF